MPEFDLIARIKARARSRPDVTLGIGDDAALLRMPPEKLLVVATDTLNAGVHFPMGTAPADVGRKALAVNLSDLAAMGAQPAWCTLSLSLPGSDAAWLDGFLDGVLALADQHGIALVGGDTTRGPLSICVTVHGLVDDGAALRRDGARIGDEIWVSGTLGDAAGALAQWREGQSLEPSLRARLERPTPRVALGLALADVAHAAIDVSDGLLADLAHVCKASGVCAEVDVDALPASSALHAIFDDAACLELQATGGDDYELCFTVAADQRDVVARIAGDLGIVIACIGRIVPGVGVRAKLADGSEWRPLHAGYVHFE